METPVYDFLRRYAAGNPVRLHMPGHKGRNFLGCESLDITEITGVESLYSPPGDCPPEGGGVSGGILRQSERNAAALFGTAETLYATEGSSQCIRAMVHLAAVCRAGDAGRYLLAGRNAHKALLYGAALAGLDIKWLWPERRASLCACAVSPAALAAELDRAAVSPAAVYLTSPDYLGGTADVAGCAAVCRARHVPLLVDNAHGAYLRFLPESRHPMDLGADVCCDSAHKTLPVLTGGAYLHLSAQAPESYRRAAREAMALHGSTSPSWLTLASLDLCNRYLADCRGRYAETVERLDGLREQLRGNGWQVEDSDPFRVTLCGDTDIMTARLRAAGIEWEYADRDYLVLMATPENAPGDLDRVRTALGRNPGPVCPAPILPAARPETVLTPREAIFAPQETVPVEVSAGRVCASPTVGCPPAIPIVAAGERIDREAVELFRYYGVRSVSVAAE